MTIDPVEDLGIGHNKAARGDHGETHLSGVTLTGSRGGGTALVNLIAILVTNFGMTDSTTA